ncbi:MAG: hypothetical protein QMB98_03285 [Flaviflexus sp.]|uniref:hypothetical protein n=1 Tax=Flaviflexus sp. TaxID=1969482 RepID=UPI00352C8B85
MRSKVMSALRRGGTVRDIARTSQVDPELVRIAIEHRERLSQTRQGCSGGSCPATTADVALPIGCHGCPLVGLGSR